MIPAKIYQNRPAMAIPELKIAAWQFLELTDWNIQWPIRPFWRLYWNDAPGATLSCDNETFLLEPEHIVVLPPYSFFSSQLARPVKHFFIHFMTGARFADLERRVTALPTPEMLHTIIRSDDPAEVPPDGPKPVEPRRTHSTAARPHFPPSRRCSMPACPNAPPNGPMSDAAEHSGSGC